MPPALVGFNRSLGVVPAAPVTPVARDRPRVEHATGLAVIPLIGLHPTPRVTAAAAATRHLAAVQQNRRATSAAVPCKPLPVASAAATTAYRSIAARYLVAVQLSREDPALIASHARAVASPVVGAEATNIGQRVRHSLVSTATAISTATAATAAERALHPRTGDGY